MVVSLTIVQSPRLTNEFRAQYATDRKPRPSNPSSLGGLIPSITIRDVFSTVGDGARPDPFPTTVSFGSDPVLHSNNLEQNTLELIDNVRVTSGAHTLKLGTDIVRVSVYNDFFFNALGLYTFTSLRKFELQNSVSFTRALPFVDGGPRPLADYGVQEAVLYAQDECQVTPQVFLTYASRYDIATFPDKPAVNPLAASLFPRMRTSTAPHGKTNCSPRFGLTFYPAADGRQVIRGGAGIFYGRSPYVLYANLLTNTGINQR
ncbi:MAG: hypothetical protein NVS1B4_00260 [Gemmatimonadaceae bacterium]